MSSSLTIAKKISVGGINNVRAGFKDVVVTRFVARIVGIVSDVKVKETTFGPSMSFVGEFRATNEDGEVTAAPVCYLPAPADSLLASAFNDADGQSINFGFDIFVTPKDKKTPQDLGYSYQVKPLLETAPSNPLAQLMQGIAAPVPVKAAQLELAPAVEISAEVPTEDKQHVKAKK